MTHRNSIEPAVPSKPQKPNKPYPDFPLFPHAAGVWAKKIRGKLYYFGKWDAPDAALDKYLAQKDDLHAGRKPRCDLGESTVKEITNEFLNAKKDLQEAGELSPRTFDDYMVVAELVVAVFGKNRLVADLRPDDFANLRNKLARKWGYHRLCKAIQYTRSIFKYAHDAELIDRQVRFGPDFKRPSRKAMRLHKAKQGMNLLTSGEIRQLIGTAGPALKTMILLGINCAFGNADCGQLPLSAVDLETGWIDFPRPKTGIPRRAKLWPETIAALKDYLSKRPKPKHEEDASLVFITKYGFSWCKDTSTNPISQETAKLLRKLGINGRKGLGFYTLRHTFRTVADETKDQPSCDFIMGHEAQHMSTVYRERISDERLQAVADVVHDWLFLDQTLALNNK